MIEKAKKRLDFPARLAIFWIGGVGLCDGSMAEWSAVKALLVVAGSQ